MHKLGKDELAFSNEKTNDKIEAEMDFGKCLGESMVKYSESREKPQAHVIGIRLLSCRPLLYVVMS